MDERYLLEEMVKCKDKIRHLQTEIGLLEDNYDYLKALYYQLEEVNDSKTASLFDLNERIRTDGFIIGIMF